MKKQEAIPVVLVSTVLLIYIGLILFFPRSGLVRLIYVVSPLLLCWMVYRVIRLGEYKGIDLKENEEWSYADKQKDELNIF